MESDNFSWYRTKHEFEHVADVDSLGSFSQVEEEAKVRSLSIFPLGNGSNVFFRNEVVQSLVLRNMIPEEIEYCGEDIYDVSSSVRIVKLLRVLLKEGRDGPYNLASVPATIGGAVAMNAGTGKRESKFIGKYLIDVTYWLDGKAHVIKIDEMELGYRRSIFSEEFNGFIASARFFFPKVEISGNPLKERLLWAKQHQDLGTPNCGTAYRAYDPRIMALSRKIFHGRPAWLSKKSPVWISNRSKNPKYIRRILCLVHFIHRLLRKKDDLEIRVVK